MLHFSRQRRVVAGPLLALLLTLSACGVSEPTGGVDPGLVASSGGATPGDTTSTLQGGSANAAGALATGATTPAGGASTQAAGGTVGGVGLGGALGGGGLATVGGMTGIGGTLNTGGLGSLGTGGASVNLGGSNSVGGSGATLTGGAGGMLNVGGAATGGAATGGAATMGGAGGTPVTDGPAANPVFTTNVKLNDDTGRGRQSEVALATGPNGLAMAGWMDERSQRVCAFSVSTDSGATWSENYSIGQTTGDFVGDPAVGIDAGGTLYAACQEYGLDQIRMMTSTDAGANWSEIRQIQSAPDKPWVGGGVKQGEVFVSWLGQQAGIKRSLDGGLTWEATEPLGNIIHGTAIVASAGGLVHVPYNLDSNRNQLRYLRSTDGGSSWDDLRDLVPDMGSFCFSCSPRQHPIVGADADPTGQVVAITWASRMGGSQAEENVWLLYSKDGGDTWSEPIGVHADETDARQFQPWVAVDAHGRVHVAWTDLRDDGLNKTFYARSEDPTQGFEPSIQVTDDPGSADTDFLGDYKGIAVSGPDVLIVWQDTRNDGGDIYFSRAPGAAGP